MFFCTLSCVRSVSLFSFRAQSTFSLSSFSSVMLLLCSPPGRCSLFFCKCVTDSSHRSADFFVSRAVLQNMMSCSVRASLAHSVIKLHRMCDHSHWSHMLLPENWHMSKSTTLGPSMCTTLDVSSGLQVLDHHGHTCAKCSLHEFCSSNTLIPNFTTFVASSLSSAVTGNVTIMLHSRSGSLHFHCLFADSFHRG